MSKVNLDKLDTEQINSESIDIDKMSPLQIATLMNDQDRTIAERVSKALPQIAMAIEAGEKTLKKGGRILYIGAGTSGRLGILDASECPPTFGVSPDTFVGIIAGGEKAICEAVEGAEDDEEQAVTDLRNRNITDADMLIGLAASGRTPYVKAAIRYASSLGCVTVSVACVSESEIGKMAQIPIEVVTGAEVITGSTRLRAGTAEKMVLNMISTGTMVRMGKVFRNFMVDLIPTNEKLKERCIRILTEATGVDRETAIRCLEKNEGNMKETIKELLEN